MMNKTRLTQFILGLLLIAAVVAIGIISDDANKKSQYILEFEEYIRNRASMVTTFNETGTYVSVRGETHGPYNNCGVSETMVTCVADGIDAVFEFNGETWLETDMADERQRNLIGTYCHYLDMVPSGLNRNQIHVRMDGPGDLVSPEVREDHSICSRDHYSSVEIIDNAHNTYKLGMQDNANQGLPTTIQVVKVGDGPLTYSLKLFTPSSRKPSGGDCKPIQPLHDVNAWECDGTMNSICMKWWWFICVASIETRLHEYKVTWLDTVY